MPSPRTLILTKSTSRPKLSLRDLRTSCIASEPETAAVRLTGLKSSHTSHPLVTPAQLHQATRLHQHMPLHVQGVLWQHRQGVMVTVTVWGEMGRVDSVA